MNAAKQEKKIEKSVFYLLIPMLPPPAELTAEIVTSLEAALEEFRALEEVLNGALKT